MEKNYYTLKEILLSLRKEQLHLANKLHILKTMLNNYGDPRYHGSHFFVGMVDDMPCLYYNLRINLDASNHEHSSLQKNGKWFNFEEIPLEVVKRNNGNYDLATTMVNVQVNKHDKFNEIVEEVLDNRFLFNGKQSMIFEDNVGLKELVTNCSGIVYTNNGIVKNLEVSPVFSYYASKDLVTCDFPFADLHSQMDEAFMRILKTKFPKAYFSEYVQEIIENSEETKREMILPSDIIYQRHVDFNVFEENDAYVLKKNHYL